MTEYFDPDDKLLNEHVTPELAAEIVALQDQLSDKIREARQQRLAGLKKMPKCPECKIEVFRPRCPFELGGGCPRHALARAYGGMSKIGHKFGLIEAKTP